MASNDVRSAIGELRQILSTPIRVYDDELSLSGTYSESDCLDDADLPGLIPRVLGKRESLSVFSVSSQLSPVVAVCLCSLSVPSYHQSSLSVFSFSSQLSPVVAVCVLCQFPDVTSRRCLCSLSVPKYHQSFITMNDLKST